MPGIAVSFNWRSALLSFNAFVLVDDLQVGRWCNWSALWSLAERSSARRHLRIFLIIWQHVPGVSHVVRMFKLVTSPEERSSLQTVIISRFLLNLRRTQERPPAPSRPSAIRSSIFHVPTIPDLVEDMGRPVDHGLRAFDEAVDGDIPDEVAVAGPSFVQGSSVSRRPTSRRQAEQEELDTVCHRVLLRPRCLVLTLIRSTDWHRTACLCVVVAQ